MLTTTPIRNALRATAYCQTVGDNFNKMGFKEIQIDYWVYPDGEDFAEMAEFTNEVNRDYLLSINKKRGDGYGGGYYDLIIKIVEDISLLELAKSYAEDGIKIIVGYSLKTIFQSVKKLFKKNKELSPSIEELTIDYKDCKIKIYNLYENAIEDSFDEIIKKLSIFRLEQEKFFQKIKTIHIPIINHTDSYNLCEFRVKLNVDEPIGNFNKSYYFKHWGLKTKNKKYIFDLNENIIFEQNFFTQKGYDKLFEKNYN